MVDKKACFLQICFYLSKWNKKITILSTKKHIFIFFEIFWWKTHPELRYNHKKSNFACKSFFRWIYISAQNKFATKKGSNVF